MKKGRDARTVVIQRGLDAAVEGLTRDRSPLSLVEANREIDKLLRGGQRAEVMTRKEAAHA